MKTILKVSSLAAIIIGVILLSGGLWGITFTYKNITQEKIVTPSDASIPNVLVKGPFTLKAQADIIREHTLKLTNGKTCAEMPRQIPEVDQSGNPVLDTNGNQVMTENVTRNIWITATSLITALNLGILTYVFSGLFVLFGCISIWTGLVFRYLANKGAFI